MEKKQGSNEDAPRKVALVTGGAVRIGRALSIALAREGFDVAVHYHSSSSDARSLKQEILGLGRECLTVQADLGVASQVGAVVDAAVERFGRLDLVINNASLFHEQPLFEADVEEWDRVFAVNLRAPFLVAKAAREFLQASRGCLINIVDVSAFEAWVRYPHHSVSKAGLLHLTRIMARELAPDVRVNAIAPGTVLPPEEADSAEIEREVDKTLVGALGSPQDVVDTALFLERSPFITGEVIVVDGGMRWR